MDCSWRITQNGSPVYITVRELYICYACFVVGVVLCGNCECKRHRVCEFIKINIIISSTNCFSFNTLLRKYLFSSTMFVHFASFYFVFFHSAASQSVIYWNGRKCTLYSAYRGEDAGARANEWANVWKPRNFSSIIIKFRISVVVCTLSVVRSLSIVLNEFDPENVIKISLSESFSFLG